VTSTNLPNALVGYTGFVGSNIAVQRDFELLVNSSNVDSLRGGEFGTVVFSAARAEKWKANLDPAADLAHVDDLKEILDSFVAEQLVLISTVDVYLDPRGVDESSEISVQGLHAYGRHRYELEQHARKSHPNVVIARLPALFGAGLKKNIVFDFLNDNNLDRIDSRGSFQFYNVGHLADDLDRACDANITLINVNSVPVTVAEVAAAAFGVEFTNQLETEPASYDVRTLHAHELGANSDYLYSRGSVLDELTEFARTKGLA
jgi:nucleoside-diphosphate-sugar epimerase